MKLTRLLLLVLKDYIKRPFMWFILLSIPLICLGITISKTSIDEHDILVGYYIEEAEGNLPESMDRVRENLANYDGIFAFVEYTDKDALIKDIQKSNLECAYVFNDDLVYNMLKGDRDEIIDLYVSPETTMDDVINETLFSIIFPVISEKHLEKYLTDNSDIRDLFKDGVYTLEDIDSLYNMYYSDGSTFRFDYEGQPDSFKITPSSILLSPINGIIAIMILLTSFCGALVFYKDSDNPIFRIWKVRIAYITIPSLLSFLSGAVSIVFISGEAFANPFSQIGKLFLYTIMCIIFVCLISIVIKSETMFAAFIPIFLLGCLVFSPIFIDVALFSPVLKPVSYLFLPYYYLIM